MLVYLKKMNEETAMRSLQINDFKVNVPIGKQWSDYLEGKINSANLHYCNFLSAKDNQVGAVLRLEVGRWAWKYSIAIA